LLRGDQVMMVP